MDTITHLFSHPLFLYALTIGLPMLGASIKGLLFGNRSAQGARLTTGMIWLTWLIAIVGLAMESFQGDQLVVSGLQGDVLSWVMAVLILFVSGIVHHFSLRYMAGDRQYHGYFVRLSLVTSSALLMVFADHLLLLLAGWGLSNLLLVRLMMHKTSWKAAYESGMLALRTFSLGLLFLGIAFGMLVVITGSFSLQAILQAQDSLAQSPQSTIALMLIILAAMTQSAQLPFQNWLISSLNSPTPVSALMHAGLVNGGGFLLARFAPLYLTQDGLFPVLFIIGVITAIVGTFWKLVQSDIKRMLACSTMGQMGFMVMQCGLGLFPAAVAHLCWHGLFKAFLFLSAGSTVREKRRSAEEPSTPAAFLLACLGGLVGAFAFAYMSHKPFLVQDTTAILLGFAFIATTQVAQTVIATGRLATRLIPALALSLLAGGLYGTSVHAVEALLAPLALSVPQPLTGLHLTAFGLIFLIWLAMNLKSLARLQRSRAWHYFYVSALNGSQPDPDTTTPVRTAYQY